MSQTGNERRKFMGNNGVIYGMAFIGALVYFIQHAIGFWGGVAGIFKALFWPAMVLYKVLGILNL